MLELPFESILRWVKEKDIVIQLSEQVNSRNYSPHQSRTKMMPQFLTAMAIEFDHYCKGINGMFRKWGDRESKQQFISHYSLHNWKQLTLQQKKRHSLANCKECAILHHHHQQTFPGPTYNPATPDSLKKNLRE